DGIVKSWRWLVHGLLEEHDQLEDSLGSAWDLWVTHINAAIAPIKAHITVQDSSGKERGWAADLGATAYSALVIEIFNDVATNTLGGDGPNTNAGCLSPPSLDGPL